MPGQYSRDLTDAELRTVARLVARTLLEVERGHRPAKVLRGFLAPHLYHGLQHATPRPGATPVGSGDIGRASFTRLTATTAYAAVAIRDHHGAWDALSIMLRRNQSARWQFVDITRASQQPASATNLDQAASPGGGAAR